MKTLRYLPISLLLTASSTPLSAGLPVPQLTGLGDLPGGNVRSYATGVSSDGTTVCGNSSSTKSSNQNSDSEGFRWRATTGMSGQGFLSFAPSVSYATGVSSNGTKISGYAAYGAFIPSNQATRWVEGSSLKNIGYLPSTGYNYSEGKAISDNGLKIVGYSTTSAGIRAFRWTASNSTSTTGTMVSLGIIRSGSIGAASEALGISGDGLAVVGSSTALYGTPGVEPEDPPTVTGFETEAFRFGPTGGMTNLGDLPGGAIESKAFAASTNGSVIVGYGTPTGNVNHGVIWNNGVISSVGDLPGGTESCQLLDVSGDGSIAVGFGNDSSGKSAVIWDATYGLRSISTILTSVGANFAGWKLTSATGISANGDVIVGNGINPAGNSEAWILNGALGLLVPPEPNIPKLGLKLGTVIHFTTQPDDIYQVETSSDNSTWLPLGDSYSTVGAAASSTHSVVDTSGETSAAYRLTLLDGSTSSAPPAFLVSQGAVISFQTELGFSYQVKQSSTLTNWSNLGSAISTTGDAVGLMHSVFDPFPVYPSPSPSKKSYVLEITTP